MNPCPPCNPAIHVKSSTCQHQLPQSLFTIIHAKARHDIPPVEGSLCNFCYNNSVIKPEKKGETVNLPDASKSTLVVSSVASDGISSIPTNDWLLDPIKVDCTRWSLDLEGTTKKHKLNV